MIRVGTVKPLRLEEASVESDCPSGANGTHWGIG